MPELLHAVVSAVEARPLTSLTIAIAAILYVRLMMSDPRTR